ncbi:7-cyano-7-deazaguanine synthase [Streptomyces montanisoli]|uniref:7-cyano-7-deazaguanine synthase n=1 Tax=Streptomyces montanisoli TaxID=2798581 RepID=A0A940MC75_9ACTN|nr:7-cyano-7-deazaguanine synthase [Streptomyces montanisoli]MBP0458327.1 7-cyano-7-deazaguanine synthase [Streptomyces montanisoli]
MTATPVFHFWLPHPDAPAPGPPWQPLSESLYWESADRAPDRGPLLGAAPEWARDLQRVARAVFAADRCTSREAEFDQWTRHIRLSVPVTAPDTWRRALPHLSRLLATVTGDHWEVEFRPFDAYERPVEDPLPLMPEELASEVALFSGGLDSLGWAAQRATVHSPRALLLITFDEQQKLLAPQEAVFQAVDRRRRLEPPPHTPRPLRHLNHSQMVHSPEGSTSALERTTRSRGLLYATTAVHAAAAERVPVVHVPENGQLALNPPLSAARSGACSTRSVHPWTLHHLNRIIEEIAGPPERVVRVENPFATLTKGEVCEASKDAGLPRAVLEATLSCGAPPTNQPGPVNIPHCGLCFPCLVRRSGLLHAYGEDGTPYAADPWDPSLNKERTKHWRALQHWLATPCTVLDLVADTPLPPDARPAELLAVVERGREELRALVARAPALRRSA